MNANAKELMAELILISRAKAAREAQSRKAPPPGPEPVPGSLFAIGQRSGDGRDMAGRALLTGAPAQTAFRQSAFARLAPWPWSFVGQDGSGALFIGDHMALFPDVHGNIWKPDGSAEPICVGRWGGPGGPVFPSLSADLGDIRAFEQLRPRLVRRTDADELDEFESSDFYLWNDGIYDTQDDSRGYVFCTEHAEDGNENDRCLYPDKDGNVWLWSENEDADDPSGGRMECVGCWKNEPAAPRIDSRVGVGLESAYACLSLVVYGSCLRDHIAESRFFLEHAVRTPAGGTTWQFAAGHAFFHVRDEGDDLVAVFPDVHGNLWRRPTSAGPIYRCVGHWLFGDGEREAGTAPAGARTWLVQPGPAEIGTCVREDRLPELVNFGSAYGERVKASRFYRERRSPGGCLRRDGRGRAVFTDALTGFVLHPDVHGNVWRQTEPGTYVCEGRWDY